MKIEIENLKAQMQGRELNIYQKADALIEFNKLIDYVNELEQLSIAVVSKRIYLVKTTSGETLSLCATRESAEKELKKYYVQHCYANVYIDEENIY